MVRDELSKHQPVTSTTTIIENFETEVPEMLILMDPDRLACVCGILVLDVSE